MPNSKMRLAGEARKSLPDWVIMLRPLVAWMGVSGAAAEIHAETGGGAIKDYVLCRAGNEKPRARAGLIWDFLIGGLETEANFHANSQGVVVVEVG